MKRVVNLRLSVVCVLSFALGILSFHEVLFKNFWLLILCCLFSALAAVLFACARKKYWIICLAALCFVFLGFANFYRVYSCRKENFATEEKGVLQGRVTDIGRNGNAQNYLYLENCTFEDQPLLGRVSMYVFNPESYETGDVVVVFGTLRQTYALKDDVETKYVRYNVRYELADAKNAYAQSGSLTLGEKARKYVYDVASRFMPKNADVAYALLTGDRNTLSEDTRSLFTQAGIIHLLVVSGLHVGFVVGAFGFALKRLKLNPLVELTILLVPLGFYAYVCGFAPSIMRAVVMTACLYLTRFIHGKYDMLSSLCWAALFILIVQPAYLFDVGFQLSVLSVFGISTVYLQIARKLNKRKTAQNVWKKCARKVVDSVALSFACVVGTLFLSAYVFDGVVWAGIFANVVAIPLVFVAFLLSVFGMLPWVFHYLLPLADKVLQVVVVFARAVEKLPTVLPLKTLGFGVVVSVILLFVVGGYVNFSKKGKKFACVACAFLLAASVALASFPVGYVNGVQLFVERNKTTLVATNANKEVAVVGAFDGYSAYRALDCVGRKNAREVILYVTDTSNANVDVFRGYCDFRVKKVYLLDTGGNDELGAFLAQRNVPVVRAQQNELLGNGITVQSVYDGGLSGVVVKTGKVSVAVVLGNEIKTKRFEQLRQDVGLYVVTCAQEYFAQKGLKTVSYYQQNVFGNFGTNRCGNFTILEKSGTIQLNFRRNGI